MLKYSKSFSTILFIISALFLINLPADAVSDLEKEIAKKNLVKYQEEYGLAYLEATARNRIYNIFDRLSAEAAKDARDLNFKLYIVDAPVLNAAYLGDGNLVLFKGLVDRLKDDNQLAAVIAHELGHGVNNDIEESINLIQGLQVGGVLFETFTKGNRYEGILDVAGNIGLNLLEKGYSREQERDADEYSVSLSERAGYDSYGAIELMYILKEGGSNDTRLGELFSSHPNLDNRVDYLKDLVKSFKDAKELYYSPIATARALAQGILSDNLEMVYGSYWNKVQGNRSLNQLKNNKNLKQIEERIVIISLDNFGELGYTLELRNQVENTARVAISFYDDNNQQEDLSLAIDLIKDQYGWKLVRDPRIYNLK
ncbi:Zn-dependent protease with chaperone function [Orenia metallireducens]|jgi:Zn-dependent protease with chaperone function|uniref:M48 family metallopeptidase n=1 Tax=Orenia metallireducens TaxID=1413210 RepID=UPI000D07EB9D|nr:M48 family metallopeptidase [Orenia metallireducens]PRX30384.1 Zn-dependent protease with chaperone function [Orenia metallireducens]